MGQKKYREPEGYLAPTGAEELLDRYRAGERFFEGAQLERCQLERVNLCCADLSGVNARRAVFFGVDFADATCDGMWLDHAQLFQCSFANVDLQSVSLFGTQVAFVSFFGAKVNGDPFLETLAARDEDKARLVLSPSQGESCFVSYASAERFPSEVEQSLRRAGIVSWFMPRPSWFSSSLSENLARAIGSCDVFVFILLATLSVAGGCWTKSRVHYACETRLEDPELSCCERTRLGYRRRACFRPLLPTRSTAQIEPKSWKNWSGC
jgi:hypothetical protein